MCKNFPEDAKGRECQYGSLCARFVKKYKTIPITFHKVKAGEQE